MESCGRRLPVHPTAQEPEHRTTSRLGAGLPASEGATKLIMLHLHRPGRRRALTVPAAVRVPGPQPPDYTEVILPACRLKCEPIVPLH